MTVKKIEDVLQDNRDTWMAIPTVVGVAVGEYRKKPCIKIFITTDIAYVQTKIPKVIDGYHVVIEETGPFQAR